MAISNGYATLAQVKSALRITDSVDDTLLEQAIESASRRIDGYCGRWFYKTAQTAIKVYPFDYYNVPTQDIANTTVTVAVSTQGNGVYDQTWTQGTDYQLEPLNASLNNDPYNRIVAIGGKTFPIQVTPNVPYVQITAQWGWQNVPIDVTQACVLLSIRQFARLNAALGIVGFNDMAIQVKAVDPDVRDLLNQYRLMAVA
jgi:Phage gp6-like head-tail connector protein